MGQCVHIVQRLTSRQQPKYPWDANADQYAKAGIPFYWRVEQAAAGVPIVFTHVLDPATDSYREGKMFIGAVDTSEPFAVTIDLAE